SLLYLLFFFCYRSATTLIYTLSLHDALPILQLREGLDEGRVVEGTCRAADAFELGERLLRVHGAADGDALEFHQRLRHRPAAVRSEEHTSELQSRENLVCRLLLEKKKQSRQV